MARAGASSIAQASSTDKSDGDPKTVSVTRIRAAAWAVALLLGFTQAWRSRHAMNPDGVSYLDIADAYIAADWSAAINEYWSPLYSWILGAATLLTRPSPYWESTVVHLVNFGIYALCLGSFELLITRLIRALRHDGTPGGDRSSGGTDEWAWRLLGYSLFLWSALALISVTAVTPDMCVAALTYLACAILLGPNDRVTGWWPSFALGLTLGLAYLAKAAMLPLAFVFIASTFVAWRMPWRVSLRRVGLAAAGFALLAAPFVVAMSKAKGRPTWGAVARIAYAWCIDGAVPSIHCDAEAGERGTVIHATRQISDVPAIYEFASPIAGSYPPWYDPSYWYDGVRSRLAPSRLLSRLLVHSLEYLRFLAPVVTAFAILWWASGKFAVRHGAWRQFATLTLPAAAALVMYGAVYIQPRYVGPFLVLLSLGAFASVRLNLGSGAPVLRGAAVGLATVLMTPLVVSLSLNAIVLVARQDTAGRSAHKQWRVAEALQRAGVRTHDSVAAMGGELAPYWARLARVKVVAEIPAADDANGFWASDSGARARVTDVLAAAGAKAIVAKSLPTWARSDAWLALNGTGYYVLVLRR